METVLYDVAGGVATITMNRPESLNSVNGALGDDLRKGMEMAATDDAVRCVILTGAGKGFCAGADLNQFQDAFDNGAPAPIDEILRSRYHPIVEAIVGMEKPVVAGVNGVAAGMGASLAMACDFRIASDKARFFQAFIKIGLIPDSGSTFFLPQLVGIAKAKELSMLGPIIDSAEMLRLGLVTEVVEHDTYPARLSEFAAMLASGPTRAYGLAKKAIHYGAKYDLTSSMDYEADLQTQLTGTHDSVEGITAFLQKREAKFEGR